MFKFIAKSNRRHFIDPFVAFLTINDFLQNKNEKHVLILLKLKKTPTLLILDTFYLDIT